jgi:uncharacterized protein YndB with AHSA1/START domain
VWTYEHTTECAASPDQIWAVYTDAAAWPEWNVGIERLELSGPFAAGARGLLTPRGQDPLPFAVESTEPGRGYVSETAIAETVTMRTENRLEPLEEGGTRLTSRLSMHGPAAEFFGGSFGAAFAASVPGTLASLAARAAHV